MSKRVKVGVIGTGAISGAYFDNGANLPIIEFAAVADLDRPKAEAQAEKYGIPRVLSVDELLADPEIEVVLNLTVPQAHVPVARAAIQAGKHVYSEKPFGLDPAEGQALLDEAAAAGLQLGCAPDTFMGTGQQTARATLEAGTIGQPVAFTAFMMGRGPEPWHPNPMFYYAPGGGPMFDMGPYYLTALLNLLGPVRRYVGAASIAITDRTVGSGPFEGQKINVTTPDHVCGLLEFECGVVGTIITSFATVHASAPSPITLFGTKGAMYVPDPNGFDGEVKVRANDAGEWETVAPTSPAGYGRSVGLADMCASIAGSGRDFRCSGARAQYVLDLMAGFLASSADGAYRTPASGYDQPAPMVNGLPFGTLEA